MERTEAIEVVRKNWPSEAFTLLREALETLIPELKESEDERIRKAILGLTYLDGIEPILTKCSITAGDIRTYLEKQNHDGKKWLTPAELNRLETLHYEAGFDAGVRSEKEKQKEQEQLGAPLHGRVCSDGGHVPGLIVDSAQFHDHLKGFPDNTDVDIFIIAKEDK